MKRTFVRIALPLVVLSVIALVGVLFPATHALGPSAMSGLVGGETGVGCGLLKGIEAGAGVSAAVALFVPGAQGAALGLGITAGVAALASAMFC